MHVGVVNTISISIVAIVGGCRHPVVQHPRRWVVSPDGRLHQQRATQHVGHVAIHTLHIVTHTKTKTVLAGVRIVEAGTELNELRFHCIVDACCETLVVRTRTLQRTLLLEVVQTDIISIVSTATTQVDVVILTDTRLEHLIHPVRIGIVLKVVQPVSAHLVTAGDSSTGIIGSLRQILAILVGIHRVVDTLGNEVYTEVTLIVYLQRLVFLTALGGDDDHTISGTRTVNGTC